MNEDEFIRKQFNEADELEKRKRSAMDVLLDSS